MFKNKIKKAKKVKIRSLRNKIKRENKKQNKIKKSQIKKKGYLSGRKKLAIVLALSILIFLLLIIRVGWIQFLRSKELKQMAYVQQTLDRNINPKRGTIYDTSQETILATSSSVETVTICPNNIKNDDKEKVAKKISEIFSLDYETILKRLNRKTAIENIVKKVDRQKANELREWMDKEGVSSGINIDEDTKRYYPFNNLASQVLGFCGSDNQGLAGVELEYDEVLAGQKGKILKMTDAKGIEIKNISEYYQDPIDGCDIVLSIDATVQGIAEKYLEEACIDNKCTDGGNILIMNVKNGEILAMAGYPDFNLNDPYTINDEELRNEWSNLSSNEKANLLQGMWRNKAVSDTYEPGSTFKLVTSSAALEEKVVTDIDKAGEFCCVGYIEIAGVKMKCWRYYRPHGPESLREALMNSCNPIFIGLGQKIGVHKYYEYLNKFGFLEKTGIDLPGEAKGIFLKEEKVGSVELGTIAFGQRFEVTPLQMITMVSTIANKGKYVKPHVVKKIINNNTGEIIETEIENERVVISEDTAEKVLSMMESVVAEGTGKNASVKGYRIGGKTGTSEDGVNTGKFVTSFIGVATIDDPSIAILITLYNPTGEGGHSGGGVGAPIASQVLGEVLPYLEIAKQDSINDESYNLSFVEVPNLIGMTEKEAKNILEEKGLIIDIKVENNEDGQTSEDLIKNQIPLEGIKVKQGTNIICYK